MNEVAIKSEFEIFEEIRPKLKQQLTAIGKEELAEKMNKSLTTIHNYLGGKVPEKGVCKLLCDEGIRLLESNDRKFLKWI